jgi:hypothetical protein
MNDKRLPATHPRDVLPMSIDNMTFLVERLAQDCGPLQFMREITVNSIQAIALTPEKAGAIVWDVDWFYHAQTGIYKLCCIDTGVGMSGPEMVEYINKLSSSIHEQGQSKNFGIGAKIAAAPRNRYGMLYSSWKNGKGALVNLYFDPVASVYGLQRWEENNGESWIGITDQAKPVQIKEHGTVVTLLGDSARQNTMQPPDGTPTPSRWQYRYLNTRFFSFPDGIVVRAREGWEQRAQSFLRTVETQGTWLSRSRAFQGCVRLDDALAHWWILRENIDTHWGHNATGGHVAALFQNELYEMVSGRAGIARLQSFGVIFGAARVVIYVEPLNPKVMANTARSSLLIENAALDWTRWASRFRENLPDEIVNLQNEISGRSGEKDHRKAILDRLRNVSYLLKFSRFRVSRTGHVPLGEGVGVRGGQSGVRTDTPDIPVPKPRTRTKRTRDIYALVLESDRMRGEAIPEMNEPRTTWISEKDRSRVPPELEDRVAKFHLEANLITINADFRVIVDMIERWSATYSHVPGAHAYVEDVVHEWFEQELVETVISGLALYRAGGRPLKDLEELWSENSLTAAVLARYHIDNSIRRHLGQQLGSLKSA